MKRLSFSYIFLMFVANVFAQQFIAKDRQPLVVIPAATNGVNKPVSLLNGVWEINANPQGDVWNTDKENTQASDWKKIQVPGEPSMQGFKIVNDKEFFYRANIHIPADAKNKTVFIRFNGVYSYARVFVNGKMIREHFGGFTAWDADITPYVQPGKSITVYIGVTDRADDISYASGYAHHTIGGILRNVQLLVLPKQFINRFYVATNLANDFELADITFTVATNGSQKRMMKILVKDAKGNVVSNENKNLEFDNSGTLQHTIIIRNPVLWNQEKPYLYTVTAQLLDEKNVAEEVIEKKIGIRKVEVEGKRLLINGEPVKLRGACRHDVHPLLGRSTNRYYDSLDVVLAKEANLNFIRTSHYPPTQDFLEFADKYGLYVQEETAICFANNWREGVYKKLGESANDTAYTSRYLGQLSEMIDRDRNHAAIIMWSIGNESDYGINFQKEYEFVKSVDVSRPVSWTWPGSALKEGKRCFDIAVTHYPAYNGAEDENFGLRYKNMEHGKFPLLGDEWAHVSCYNTTMLKLDPNVKDFWGRSLDTMWAARFDVPGNLGGAIWGMIDETFHLPDTIAGYGPWGIVDVWRRKKTEFWNTKKAYSPVKVLKTSFDGIGLSQLSIPVKNRFNHLSLDKVTMTIESKGKTWRQPLPALKPHEEGNILISREKISRSMMLRFYDNNKKLIDEENINVDLGAADTAITIQQWSVKNENGSILLSNKNLLVVLDEKTGEMQYAAVKGEKIITSAPRFFVLKPNEHYAFKETNGAMSGKYLIKNININTNKSNAVIITSNGLIDQYPVKLRTTYNANGNITVEYEADSIPKHTWEIGVAFPVSWNVDGYSWKRNGYWSTYPAGHLSAIEGFAKRNTGIKEVYRERPAYEVAEGLYDYYLTGKTKPSEAYMQASEVYRATKENIRDVTLYKEDKAILKCGFGINEKQAFKMQIIGKSSQELRLINKLDYWALAWGNYQGTENPSFVKGKVNINLIQ